MKADFNFDVTDAEVIATEAGSGLELRFQTVDQPPSGPQRSEKYIHLAITPAQAMRLLAMLEGIRQHFGWPLPADVRFQHVPPAKDRN